MAGRIAPPNGEWEADFGEGFCPLDVADFIKENAETMWNEIGLMYRCYVGEDVRFGGGATPEVVVRRVK